jgi:outer membrane biosynthesis protein TonB
MGKSCEGSVMKKVRFYLLWAIALFFAGCATSEYEGKMQILVEPSPSGTPEPTSSPQPSIKPTSQATQPPTSKAVVVTPTDKVTERIYIPVYQNPIAPKKVAVSPTLKAEVQTQRIETTRSPASKSKQPENQTPVTNGSAIPAQSGSCKDLKARGFSDIDVKSNPWASRLDKDKDGVACESTNR